MTTKPGDFDMLRIRGYARDIAVIASSYGWPMPDEYDDAKALHAAAFRTARHLEPVAPPPAKAASVDAWIKAEADRRIATRERQAVANELAGQYDRDALRIALEAAPGLAGKLKGEFDRLLGEFRALLAGSPRSVTGYTPPEDAAAYSAVLRATDSLTVIAGHRARFGQILGESVRNPIWLVLDPTPDASLAEVTALAAEMNDALPTTLEQWERVAAVGASLAGYEQAQARVARHLEACWHGGFSSPDGGMRDKSYAEAFALVGKPATLPDTSEASMVR